MIAPKGGEGGGGRGGSFLGGEGLSQSLATGRLFNF